MLQRAAFVGLLVLVSGCAAQAAPAEEMGESNSAQVATGGSIKVMPPARRVTRYAGSDDRVHVYKDGKEVGEGALGTVIGLAWGGYTVVLNDSKMDVAIRAGVTTTVQAGQVSPDPELGDFRLRVATFSGAETIPSESDVPAGQGIAVLPGTYTLEHTANVDESMGFPTVDVANRTENQIHIGYP